MALMKERISGLSSLKQQLDIVKGNLTQTLSMKVRRKARRHTHGHGPLWGWGVGGWCRSRGRRKTYANVGAHEGVTKNHKSAVGNAAEGSVADILKCG